MGDARIETGIGVVHRPLRNRRSREGAVLRPEMGRPRLAMLMVRGVAVGSHERLARSIGPRIAGIECSPRHGLIVGAWSLARRGKGSRRRRGTRREHRNRAALLWNRLNQRSHIVSSLDLDVHECPGRRNVDKATRGGDGAKTVRVKIGGRKRKNGVLDKELSAECHRRILGSGIQVESGRQKKGVLSNFLFFPFHFPFRVRRGWRHRGRIEEAYLF